MNPLAKGIRDYLALRRGLGFKLRGFGSAMEGHSISS